MQTRLHTTWIVNNEVFFDQRKNTSSAAKSSSKSQQSSIPALFAKLNHDLTTRIPKMFEPPMEIVRYFDGGKFCSMMIAYTLFLTMLLLVTMDKNGQYVDTSIIKSSKSTRYVYFYLSKASCFLFALT